MVDPAVLAVTIPIVILALILALRRHDSSIAATVSVVGAAFAVLIGAVGGGPATDEVYEVGPTLLFLCILLVLSHQADAAGVFTWAAAALGRGARRSSITLFRRVFALAAVTTAVLNLDATVVLLTPVVITAVRRMRLRSGPHAYACAHMANSASLLLPISNLTNLLAFAATGLSFLHFTAIMALPWLVAIAVEYALLRRIFGAELIGQTVPEDPDDPPIPRMALTVLALTVAGFAVGSVIGLAPVWPAAAGALVLAVPRLLDKSTNLATIIESANLSFVLFVFGLAVLVRGIQEAGLAELISAILPTGTGLIELLAAATIAAVVANLVNNLPATLALIPAAALIGTPAILAVLIGVNIGANLTYIGSVANLLWRRGLGSADEAPRARSFAAIGALTVPPTLLAATTALWLSWRLFG